VNEREREREREVRVTGIEIRRERRNGMRFF